jgi:hypothetical protein
MDRTIYRVAISTNMMTCRLCGGRGRDPYSFGQSCRKCNGHKRYPTPAANAAQLAFNKWKNENASRIEACDGTGDEMQVILREAIEFINGLRGASAKVEYAD